MVYIKTVLKLCVELRKHKYSGPLKAFGLIIIYNNCKTEKGRIFKENMKLHEVLLLYVQFCIVFMLRISNAAYFSDNNDNVIVYTFQ